MKRYVIVYVPVMSDSILMIRKKRPAWQAGKLNFPGGHIEEGEGPSQAAIRELYEETGLVTNLVAEMGRIRVGPDGDEGAAVVHVFTCLGRSGEIEQKTDEGLETIPVMSLPFRNDLVDRNIMIMHGLIDMHFVGWDIYHEEHGYRIEIPYK